MIAIKQVHSVGNVVAEWNFQETLATSPSRKVKPYLFQFHLHCFEIKLHHGQDTYEDRRMIHLYYTYIRIFKKNYHEKKAHPLWSL